MRNSPIQFNDQLGNTAQPVIDKKNKTIALNANIYLYGKVNKKKLNQALMAAKKSFDEQLNNKSFKTTYDGEEYTVTFNIKLFTVADAEAKDLAKDNKSLANNFVEVENSNSTSRMFRSDNSGIFTTGDLIGKNKNTTTVVHEFFHSLGLEPTPDGHPIPSMYIQPGAFLNIIPYYEEPRIIVPRGSNIIVRQVGPVLNPITFRSVIPNERKVTQTDVDHAVEYKDQQKTTNRIYGH